MTPLPPEGYGTFELNVHTNDCYTVTGPSKVIGFLTITDPLGLEVPNPVFEFDGCFDPNGDNASTSVTFPSLLTVTSTSVPPPLPSWQAPGRGCRPLATA